jgi:ferrous iron transport protein A
VGAELRAKASLAHAPTGTRLRIARTRLDADVTAWLSAVGLREGEEVMVLRRAIFGGPLHLRSASGGEFAVGRELAERLDIEHVEAAP